MLTRISAYNDKSGDAVPIDPLASRELDAVGGHLMLDYQNRE